MITKTNLSSSWLLLIMTSLKDILYLKQIQITRSNWKQTTCSLPHICFKIFRRHAFQDYTFLESNWDEMVSWNLPFLQNYFTELYGLDSLNLHLIFDFLSIKKAKCLFKAKGHHFECSQFFNEVNTPRCRDNSNCISPQPIANLPLKGYDPATYPLVRPDLV